VLKLAADVIKLLASREGASALHVLLPILRELAMHIAGRGPCPVALRDVDELRTPIAIERAQYRWAKGQGLIND